MTQSQRIDAVLDQHDEVIDFMARSGERLKNLEEGQRTTQMKLDGLALRVAGCTAAHEQRLSALETDSRNQWDAINDQRLPTRKAKKWALGSGAAAGLTGLFIFLRWMAETLHWW